MDYDGRFRKKIYETSNLLSNLMLEGDRLALVENYLGGSTIKIIDFNDLKPKEVLKVKEEIDTADYASGEFIYTKSLRRNGKIENADVFVYNLDSKREDKITNDKDFENCPIISNDGAVLAFSKNGKIWVKKMNEDNPIIVAEGTCPIGFLE